MKKIAIFGVGLIGGSLALCFKGKPGLKVVGYSPNPASVEKYVKREVVDEATTSIEDAALDADFIFLCGPVGVLESNLEAVMRLPLKSGCIITDVGSTKQSFMAAAARLRRAGITFIGGHPMAGKEQSGVEAATSILFENAIYVLTPDKDAGEDAYQALTNLLAHTKAQIIRMEPDQHDKIVGAISHLPHIIGVALVNQIARYNDSNPLYELLAAGGFRDITRIASSDPLIWRDILLTNRDVVLEMLADWQREIGRFSALIDHQDGAAIEEEFRRAGTFRDQLPERRKGILTALFDIYVDIPDQPGIIGKITTELGNNKINLSNIQIMENRLDVPGVLKLSFREEEDMRSAISVLREIGCTISM